MKIKENQIGFQRTIIIFHAIVQSAVIILRYALFFSFPFLHVARFLPQGNINGGAQLCIIIRSLSSLPFLIQNTHNP